MHHPTDTHRTAKELSPAELAAYRRRLDQHFQNRKVDEALLHRAWHTAIDINVDKKREICDNRISFEQFGDFLQKNV